MSKIRSKLRVAVLEFIFIHMMTDVGV